MSGRIAPDQGREIDLVIGGTKPLAVIEKRKDPAQYRAAGNLPMDVAEVITILGTDGAERAVVLPGKVELIHDYLKALQMPDGDAKTRTMGKLFGYSEADIEAFIANPPVCACTKCSPSVVHSSDDRGYDFRGTRPKDAGHPNSGTTE